MTSFTPREAMTTAEQTEAGRSERQWTSSFRTTSFAAAQRMTTAEPPEPFALFVTNVLFHHEILGDVVGPSARLSVSSVYSVDYKNSCAFVSIRGSF